MLSVVCFNLLNLLHLFVGITKLEEEFKYEVWPEEILKHCPPLVDLNIFKRDPSAVVMLDFKTYQLHLDERKRCLFIRRRLRCSN